MLTQFSSGNTTHQHLGPSPKNPSSTGTSGIFLRGTLTHSPWKAIPTFAIGDLIFFFLLPFTPLSFKTFFSSSYFFFFLDFSSSYPFSLFSSPFPLPHSLISKVTYPAFRSTLPSSQSCGSKATFSRPTTITGKLSTNSHSVAGMPRALEDEDGWDARGMS